MLVFGRVGRVIPRMFSALNNQVPLPFLQVLKIPIEVLVSWKIEVEGGSSLKAFEQNPPLIMV